MENFQIGDVVNISFTTRGDWWIIVDNTEKRFKIAKAKEYIIKNLYSEGGTCNERIYHFTGPNGISIDDEYYDEIDEDRKEIGKCVKKHRYSVISSSKIYEKWNGENIHENIYHD